jgi:hypothetical protein
VCQKDARATQRKKCCYNLDHRTHPVRQHQALLIYGRRFPDDFAISENGFVAVSTRDTAGALRGGSMCKGSQVVPSEADPGMLVPPRPVGFALHPPEQFVKAILIGNCRRGTGGCVRQVQCWLGRKGRQIVPSSIRLDPCSAWKIGLVKQVSRPSSLRDECSRRIASGESKCQ